MSSQLNGLLLAHGAQLKEVGHYKLPLDDISYPWTLYVSFSRSLQFSRGEPLISTHNHPETVSPHTNQEAETSSEQRLKLRKF